MIKVIFSTQSCVNGQLSFANCIFPECKTAAIVKKTNYYQGSPCKDSIFQDKLYQNLNELNV